jgi:hypothetical protein
MMIYVTRHSSNGKSYTYPAGYAVAGFLLKVFAVACVPMLLSDVIRHGNMGALALAIPGLLIVIVKLAQLGFFAEMRGMWRDRNAPHTRPDNVVSFRKGGK